MVVEAQGKSVRKPQKSWTKKGWEKKNDKRGGGEVGREEMEQQERERERGSLWQRRSETEVGVKGAVSDF